MSDEQQSDPFDRVKLGIEVPGNELFDALRDSEYMEDRGYDTLYESVYTGEETEQKDVDGVEFEKAVESGEIEGYGLCFTHEEEPFYLHLRNGAGKESEIRYLIALGDEETIEEDLTELVHEIEDSLG